MKSDSNSIVLKCYGTAIGYDDYYPFGLQMPGRSSNLGNPNDLNKFTGHERDNEGGLMIDYMLARNYDPEIGRFMSVDPLAHHFPSWSPYNYTMCVLQKNRDELKKSDFN